MEIVNNTPAVVDVHIANLDEALDRIMTVIAKVTYSVDEHGCTQVDTADPYPVERFDREHALGMLPQDILPSGPRFEICCLGRAHAPNNDPVTEMTVSLTVGEFQRALSVVGDRHWIGSGDDARISEPLPFVVMPVTWENTFGGTVTVRMDRNSPLDFNDARNPAGKGYDPTEQATELARWLESPLGFPIIPRRPLPNVERPEARIRHWQDSPAPVCFAPVPVSSSSRWCRWVDTPMDLRRAGRAEASTLERDIAPYRAPDDLLIDLPEQGTQISLRGFSSQGDISFPLPALRILVDYCFDAHQGTAELKPSMLMLLPEERRFYLVFKANFSFAVIQGMERALRFRAEPGWFTEDREAPDARV